MEDLRLVWEFKGREGVRWVGGCDAKRREEREKYVVFPSNGILIEMKFES